MKKVCEILKNKRLTNINYFKTFQKSIKFNFTVESKPAEATSAASSTTVDYEKEWTSIYEQKNKVLMEKVLAELSEYEKKEVELLVEKLSKLNKDEKLYYAHLTLVADNLISGEDIRNKDISYPANFMNLENILPKSIPDWYSTTAMQSTVSSFSGKAVEGIASSGSASSSSKDEKKEEKKEEKKAEKAQFDIKLASFDAGKKIALIKEIRGLLNLGLKEVIIFLYLGKRTCRKGPY
jgi:large subunit ribosomal protein L7/L12